MQEDDIVYIHQRAQRAGIALKTKYSSLVDIYAHTRSLLLASATKYICFAGFSPKSRFSRHNLCTLMTYEIIKLSSFIILIQTPCNKLSNPLIGSKVVFVSNVGTR